MGNSVGAERVGGQRWLEVPRFAKVGKVFGGMWGNMAVDDVWEGGDDGDCGEDGCKAS